MPLHCKHSTLTSILGITQARVGVGVSLIFGVGGGVFVGVGVGVAVGISFGVIDGDGITSTLQQ